ncbi:DUF1249 domain-containing protein [Alcanivorax sp. 1008]|uniref:DUF1249 domain-containing protein n=1 Tax=Alcanivorax sp. 1008 TaxID=2816853 RepID=UPI001DF9A05F|nr:DUF1249 domain-containing protein [Alcanivorax sp. 1008]MCC1495965.1 DUF1249 domain-containing protein [Alcanivorax sp. 1008]
MTESWAANKRYRVDLPELISQGEQNYARLMRLMRALGDADHVRLVVGSQGERTLNVRVLQRCRYTTEISLQQDTLHALLPGPSLTVRLYHDARLAEVTEASPFQRVAARHDYPNPAMHQRDEKQQWNRFLGEWLRHLHDHGRADSGSWREQVGVRNG